MRLAAALLLLLTSTVVAQPGATPPSAQPVGDPPQQPVAAQPPAPYPQQPAYAPAPYPQQPVAAQPPAPYPQQPAYAPAPYPQQPAYAPAPSPALQQPPYAQPPNKNESTATWLAIGATAAGLGTIYLGAEDNNEGLGWAGVALTLIGPSAGHIYAGEHGHAAKLSLLRIGGFLTFAYGVAQGQTQYDCIDYCPQESDGEAAMWLGGAVVVGATIYDFLDASKAARRANRKQERAWQVTPMMMSARGQRSPGVGVMGSF